MSRASLQPRSQEPSDADLIETIRSTSSQRSKDSRLEIEAAYRVLVERYWKVVLVLMRSRVSSDRDAEDLTQEAFLRAFRSLDRLETPKVFLAWLLKISRNLATDHLRKRRPDVSLEGLGDELAETSRSASARAASAAIGEVERKLELAEDVDLVLQAVARLPEKYSTVITLRYLQEYSHRELAERLGEPEGTIRNRVFRALGKLREMLERSRSSALAPNSAPSGVHGEEES